MKTIYLILFVFISCSVGAQDILFFKTGLEYKAKIVKVSESEVEYKNYFVQDEPISIAELSELISIKYENGKQLIVDTKLYQSPPTKFVQNQNPNEKKKVVAVAESPISTKIQPSPPQSELSSVPSTTVVPPVSISSSESSAQISKLIEKVEKLQSGNVPPSSNKEVVDAFKELKKSIEILNATNQQILESNQKMEGTLRTIKGQNEERRQESADISKDDFAVRTFALGFTFENAYIVARDEGGVFWGGNMHAVINFAKSKKVGFRLEPEINIAGSANETGLLAGSVGFGFYPVRNLQRVRIYGGPYFGVAFANEIPGVAFGVTAGGEYLVTKHFSVGLSTGYYGHFIVSGSTSLSGSSVDAFGFFRLANLNARFYF